MRNALLMALLAILIPCFAQAATYHVANWGNDAYNGLSWDSAFATLQHAADIVTDGDSVLAANGDYVGFDLRSGGNATQPIVFRAFGDSVFITAENPVTPDGINIENADWVVIDGYRVIGIARAGIRVAVSQHVTIRNCFCTQNGKWGIFTGFADYAIIERNECAHSIDEHGIYFSNSADHPTIRYNCCHHNNSCGIHMNGDESMGGDGLITDANVYCNTIYENGNGGGSGINCDGVAESNFFNNLLYMNHASGMSLYQIDASAGSYHDRIFNNTIINAADGRWCLNINSGSFADTLYNNILINFHSWRGSISIDSSSIPGFFSDYNIVVDRFSNDGGNSNMPLSQWQSLGYDINSMLADSLDSIFVDWQNDDFHLLEDAQAVDNGTGAVSAVVQYDLDSIPRPQGTDFDIGCYEYAGSGIDEYSTEGYRRDLLIRGDARISFDHLDAGDRIRIFDMSGRKVADSGVLRSERYYWNSLQYPGGCYFYIVMGADLVVRRRGKLIHLRGGTR